MKRIHKVSDRTVHNTHTHTHTHTHTPRLVLVKFLNSKSKTNIPASPRQFLKWRDREFPGGPMVRIPHFHYREHRFNPWLRN